MFVASDSPRKTDMEHPPSLKTGVGAALPGNEEIEAGAQVQFDFAGNTPLPGEVAPTTNQFEEIRPPHDVEPRQSFGEWLLARTDRKGWIGDLAKAAKADRDFPKRGSPGDVRKRLQQMGADGDAFEALDDAELDWSSV
jgi:hypothetical protein